MMMLEENRLKKGKVCAFVIKQISLAELKWNGNLNLPAPVAHALSDCARHEPQCCAWQYFPNQTLLKLLAGDIFAR